MNKEYHKQWYENNREKVKEDTKQWRIDNPEKVREIRRLYRENNIEKLREYDRIYKKTHRKKQPEYDKQYYVTHKEECNQRNKKYYQLHKEEIHKKAHQYSQNNKVEIRIKKRDYVNNRRKTNVIFSLNCKMSNAIYYALKENKNGRHWEDLVGYTLDNLIKRLKLTMPEGYNWEDVLNGRLHIDHIIPKSVFNYTKPEHSDFKKCWDLTNLRLLPAKENMNKSNKLSKPFQPALAM